MDWDNVTAEDLLAVFNSFCKGSMIIEKVQIFPSLYGLEQMKKDALYGPPKELYNPNKKAKGGDSESESESMGSEEGEFEMDEEEGEEE